MKFLLEANAFQNIEDTNTGNTKIDSEESKNIPLVLGEREEQTCYVTNPSRNIQVASTLALNEACFSHTIVLHISR